MELFLTTLTVIIFSLPLILTLNKSPELKMATSLLISLFVLLGIITFDYQGLGYRRRQKLVILKLI